MNLFLPKLMTFKSLMIVGVILLTGCASTNLNPAKDCNYVYRDLTKNWEDRTYWCVPSKQEPQGE